MKKITRVVPWLITMGIGCFCLISNSVPINVIFHYTIYWMITIVGPGTLVYWALHGQRYNIIEDLGFGSVVGLTLEIIVWYLLSVTGRQELIRWWWVPIYLLFVSTPFLRRHVSNKRDNSNVSWWWGWGICLVISITFIAITTNNLQKYLLPPTDSEVYLDLWWHLSLNHELARTAWPQLPQVAGVDLHYHWFANVHMAAAHLITGISEPLILLRLWIFPVVVVATIVIAGLARQVSDAEWTGPVTALLVIGAFNGGDIWPFYYTIAASPINFLSPSMTFSLPFLVVAVSLIVDLIRGRNNIRHFLLLFLVTATASGVKPTITPLLLAGLGLVIIFQLIRDHRVPVRNIVCIGIVALITIWSFNMGAGKGSSKIIFFDLIGSAKFYSKITGDVTHYAASDGLLRSSLNDFPSILAAALVFIWLFFSQTARIIGLACLGYSRTRRDEAVWFLSGIVLAGYGLSLMVAHVGLGQIYFMLAALPFGVVLSAYLVETASRGAQYRYELMSMGAIGGFGIGLLARSIILTAPTSTSLRDWYIAIGTPILVFVIALLVFVLVIKKTVRTWRFSKGAFLAMVGSAFLSLPLIEATNIHSKGIMAVINRPNPPKARQNAADFVSKSEQEAAIWLNENSKPEDIIATNLHCRPAANRPDCSATAFWLSGLSGRRVLLEGWAYAPLVTQQEVIRAGHYTKAPSPWPERKHLSDSVVSKPNKEVIGTLLKDYGVRWLFAVERASPSSPELKTFADLKFQNEGVSIYRIRK